MSNISKVSFDGNTLIDLTSDTVTASDILSGKMAHNSSGNIITGTIPSLAAATFTPSTADQTIAAGNYLSGAQTISGDTNLIASNIKNGTSIFGVTGTLSSVVANGTIAGGDVSSFTLSTGLPTYLNWFCIVPQIVTSSAKLRCFMARSGYSILAYYTSSVVDGYFSTSMATFSSGGRITINFGTLAKLVNGYNYYWYAS